MSPPDMSSQHQSGKEPSHLSGSRIDPRGVQDLTVLLFVTLSSALFLCLFEWDRYRIIVGPRWPGMSMSDRALIFWLLLGKSMAWFTALLPIVGLLMALRLTRSLKVIANLYCVCALVLMAADLVSVGFAGYHIGDYLPNISDIVNNPNLYIWQWAGDGLMTEALILVTVLSIAALICSMSAKWLAERLAGRFEAVCSRKTLTMATLGFLCVPIGAVSAMQFFHDQNVLDRLYATLPLTPGMKESCQRLTNGVASRMDNHYPGAGTGSFALGQRLELSQGVDGRAFRASDGGSNSYSFGLPKDSTAGWSADTRRGAFHWGRWPEAVAEIMKPLSHSSTQGLIESRYPGPIRESIQSWGLLGADGLQSGNPEGLRKTVNSQDELTALNILRNAVDPDPADQSAFVQKPDLPNVILIIFESFRHAALGPELMKELDAWADQGLRLRRHYSGSNCSHLGLFSLFYGRAPVGYHETLDRKIPAQMLETLRRSGYRISFLTAGETKGFRRLDQFINAETCDDVIEEGEFTLKGMADWPESDRRKLEKLRNIVDKPSQAASVCLSLSRFFPLQIPVPPGICETRGDAGYSASSQSQGTDLQPHESVCQFPDVPGT